MTAAIDVPATPAAARVFAEVAVNTTMPATQPFSYSVPPELALAPGSAVYVPFGRLTLQGIVLDVHDRPVFAEPEKIRPIRATIADAPLLDAARIALARWIADYYLAPIFEAVALFLPPGFERKAETIVLPLWTRDGLEGIDLTPRQREVMEALVAAPGCDLDDLRDRLKAQSIDATLAQLERRGLLARQYRLSRPRIGPKTVEVATLAVPADDGHGRIDAQEPPRKSRRGAVIERLLERRRISDDDAVRLAGSRGNFERLLRAGVVRPDREGHNIELALSRAEAVTELRSLTQTRRSRLGHAAVDALAARGEAAASDLRKLGVDAEITRWLAGIGAIATREAAIERDPLAHFDVARREPPALLPAQAAAADAISNAVAARRQEVFLLHGVTGSGKTEVYLHALDQCVEAGRRAIVLVPEIALTPQTVRRFRERFERVAVLHSGLSDGELFDQWHGIAAGRYDVVVGARSAIFAPQPDLGLIVVDEEHEWTYKQHDAQPRYHAREVGIELGRLTDAAIVLGSATPDVATYQHALDGRYTMLTLPDRLRPGTAPDGRPTPHDVAAMPRVSVVDLRDELHSGNRSMFSRELQSALEEVLRADEQAILFLNRRGLAGHIQCRDCGFVPDCSSCSVALTYHRDADRLVCHQCNRRTRLPSICRQCGSPRIRLLGAGIEKVELEASRLFPHARLLRWDRDAARTRGAHERILAAFLAHEADILVGTQMLAKGLDMPSVTLVGVVNADVALHLPDFRTGERTFQLLTQVAGRAGRGERPGRVIVQTYTPDHYAIEAAARHDFEGFAETELEARRSTGYPPFGRLVRLTLMHPTHRSARDEAMRLHRALAYRRGEQGTDTEILGPSPAYVPRVRGRWRWQLLLRGREPAGLIRGFLLPRNVTVDVDPVSI